MADELVPAIVRDGFSIRVEGTASYSLVLSGNADMEMLSVLGSFLAELHKKLRARRVASVRVDFRDLYFMNSSCFKSFIVWIASIKKLDVPDSYLVRFVTNPAFRWQARNIEAMQEFAPHVVVIEKT